MRSILALMRASYLNAASYRLAMVFSVAGLLATFVPLYFISHAVQPVARQSIALEGGDYFGFVVFGLAALLIVSAALSAVGNALAGSISSGTLEALLVTRTPLYQTVLGLVGYTLAWSGVRAVLLVAAGAAMGTSIAWGAMPWAVLIAVLLVITYFAIGLVSGSLIMVFRTAGPLNTAVMWASGLFGGVYYATSVIPSAGLKAISSLMPLTYGLRATRRLLLAGASFAEVSDDVVMLTGFAAVSLGVSLAIFAAALRRARVAGTLSQY